MGQNHQNTDNFYQKARFKKGHAGLKTLNFGILHKVFSCYSAIRVITIKDQSVVSFSIRFFCPYRSPRLRLFLDWMTPSYCTRWWVCFKNSLLYYNDKYLEYDAFPENLTLTILKWTFLNRMLVLLHHE